ncbi:uncharacterized protein LOC142054196 isoform X4 [Phalacrocorax aristotelis]|uniref:uncharacterized protein LOC142054196 isoform X4 n=1 Tax=Phalacrocorax aristotelis TaxID=126867 RepID=UPI003F4C3682
MPGPMGGQSSPGATRTTEPSQWPILGWGWRLVAQRDLPCPLPRRPWALSWAALPCKPGHRGPLGQVAPQSPAPAQPWAAVAAIVCQCDVTIASQTWALFKQLSGRLGCPFDYTRASEQMGKRGKSTSEMGGKAERKKLWRCWRSLSNMARWKLTLLLYVSSLSLWGLCTLVLPCTLSFFAVLGLIVFLNFCIKSKAKETSAGTSCRRSKRKELRSEQPRPRAAPGSTVAPSREIPLFVEPPSWLPVPSPPLPPPSGASVPWEGVEGSTKSLKSGWAKPHGGERRESSSGSKGAPAGKLPGHTAGVGQRANVTAETTSALLRSPPSITNRDELARCLIQSLDINRICLNMVRKLRKAQHSTAAVLYGDMREEYLVCLQCRRCLVGSCPHYSKPAAEEDLPVLAIILHTAHILRYEEIEQLEMGLGFELTMAGDLLYMWDRTQRIPEIAPERCCEVCNVPLPRSPGDSGSSQPSLPTFRAQATPHGDMRPSPQKARAPPARQPGTDCGDASTAELQLAGQGQPLPSPAPMRPLPSWAQPLSPAALDRLRRVAMEPLPCVEHRGLGRGVSLQCIRRAWYRLKSSVRRSLEDEQGCLWAAGSSADNGTTEGERTVPFDLQFQGDALLHTMEVEL